MKDKLEKLKKEINEALMKVKNVEVLKELEIKYFGRKGKLTALLKGIAGLRAEQRKEVGRLANTVKAELASKLNEIKAAINPENKKTGFVDVTLPGKDIKIGHEHPITLIENELEDMFVSLGFMILDGPELESDYFNFEALNIPKWHPARDMQDTFYIDSSYAKVSGDKKAAADKRQNKDDDYDLVMRTHTSPMQVRAMLKYGAPLRCVVPGRVFRNEATDAVHDATFNQLEGLMIGEDISVANLIAVMDEMLKGIFKKPVETRVRPGYFPFTEPSIEVDVRCTQCNGEGCGACKHTGWLEMVGSGMVHPNVLRAGNIDPDKYSGFAFGLGTTRLAMMKYGISDIRLFNSGDLRFLEQF